MDQGNQHGHDATIRMPLHPRKAQELFFELLQVTPNANQSPRKLPTPRSFQQRVAHTQQFCSDALKLLQRGQWIHSLAKHRSDPMVLLRLSSDGSKLEIHALKTQSSNDTQRDDNNTADLTQVDALEVRVIQSLTVFSTTGEFAFLSSNDSPGNPMNENSLFHSRFEAETDDLLTRIAVAVTSGVSAQREAAPTTQQNALLWQAIRLRIIELTATGLSLHDATNAMERAYEALAIREIETELPTFAELCLLRTG